MEATRSVAAAAPAVSAGWLRGPGFDVALLVGPLALGILAAGVVVARPDLFGLVLGIDLALLGYPHVVATYSRLYVDPAGRRAHRLLAWAAPPAVLLATVGLAAGLGAAAVATVYFHWQLLHYGRQAHGIERAYARRAGGGGRTEPLTWLLVHGLPLAGLLHRSAEAQPNFLGLEVRYLPVAGAVAAVAWVAVGVVGLAWLGARLRASLAGRARPARDAFVAGHVAAFAVGYGWLDSLNAGWLLVNVWHNAQYLLVVWHANRSRFGAAAEAPADRGARVLVALTRPRRAGLYLGVTLLAALAFYAGVDAVAAGLTGAGLPVALVALVLYQAINFHHYLVDGVIWKLRRPEVRAALAPGA